MNFVEERTVTYKILHSELQNQDFRFFSRSEHRAKSQALPLLAKASHPHKKIAETLSQTQHILLPTDISSSNHSPMMHLSATVFFAFLANYAAATASSHLRGAVQVDFHHRVNERQTTSTICSKNADGSDKRCHTDKCFAVHMDGQFDGGFSASLVPAQDEGEVGRRVVFYEGNNCNRHGIIGMSSGIVNAVDSDDALLRLGMTESPTSDGSRFIPFAVIEAVPRAAQVEEDEQPDITVELEDKTAFARKLDKYEGKYAVVVPNFAKNQGPISEEDSRCVTGETVMGASTVGYLRDEAEIDGLRMSFNELPIRTKCGTDELREKSRYCKCT